MFIAQHQKVNKPKTRRFRCENHFLIKWNLEIQLIERKKKRSFTRIKSKDYDAIASEHSGSNWNDHKLTAGTNEDPTTSTIRGSARNFSRHHRPSSRFTLRVKRELALHTLSQWIIGWHQQHTATPIRIRFSGLRWSSRLSDFTSSSSLPEQPSPVSLSYR